MVAAAFFGLLLLPSAVMVAAEMRLVRFGPAPADIAAVPSEVLESLYSGNSLEALKQNGLDQRFVAAMYNRKRRPGFLDLTDVQSADHLDSSEPGSQQALTAPVPTYPTPNATAHPELKPFFKEISPAALEGTISSLGGFHNRYFRGPYSRAASIWVRDAFAKILVGDDSVTLFDHSPAFNQPSVIARIPSSRNANGSVTIISAHLDSINDQQRANGLAPGADDDASGIAVLLEVARILREAKWKPAEGHILELHAYGGEEGGLLGSARVAADYKLRRIPVRAVLQLDMVAYQREKLPVITILRDTGGADLQGFASKLIKAYIPNSTVYENECNYPCSDHFSWHEQGYPALSIDESGEHDKYLNPYAHTANDSIDKLDMTLASAFVKLALAWAVELTT